jgi:hypothetical protein
MAAPTRRRGYLDDRRLKEYGMSIRVMTVVWDDLRTQTDSELLVQLALADWANDDGYC